MLRAGADGGEEGFLLGLSGSPQGSLTLFSSLSCGWDASEGSCWPGRCEAVPGPAFQGKCLTALWSSQRSSAPMCSAGGVGAGQSESCGIASQQSAEGWASEVHVEPPEERSLSAQRSRRCSPAPRCGRGSQLGRAVNQQLLMLVGMSGNVASCGSEAPGAWRSKRSSQTTSLSSLTGLQGHLHFMVHVGQERQQNDNVASFSLQRTLIQSTQRGSSVHTVPPPACHQGQSPL